MYMQLLVWIALPGVWKASWGGRGGMKGVSGGGGGGGGPPPPLPLSSYRWKPCLPFLWAPLWKGSQRGEGGRECVWQWEEEDHIRVCQVFLLWSSPCTQAKQKEGIYQEKGGTTEGGGTEQTRKRGREGGEKRKKKKRSRRSFTEIICTQGVCVRAHSSFCGCVPPHIYSAQVHGFSARHYAPVIKRFSTAHQQCLIIALISAQTATAC